MVGDDHNAVEFRDLVERRAGHIELVSAPAADEGEKRIVVLNMRTALLQQLDDGECGRLAKVVDIAFVGHPQYQDAGTAQSLVALAHGFDNIFDHEVRHGNVDLPSQLNKPRVEVKPLGSPGKVKRVDGNAVTAETGPWIKCLEAERLGLCSVDH